MIQQYSKTLLLICSLSAIGYMSHAQNTFPSSGNVGIGTLSPANKLTVLTGTSTTGIVHTDGAIKVGTYVGGAAGWLGTVSNHPLYFYTNNGGAQLVLLTNGRVGIGTTSPAGKLDIAGGDAFIQGVKVGLGGKIADTTNTCLGRDALQKDTAFFDGINNANKINTAVGYRSLRDNTTGMANSAIGAQSLISNTTGTENTAVGVWSLGNNKTGSYNVAVGSSALSTIEAGTTNTAIGYYAMAYNYDPSIGYSNAVNTTGNTALGAAANQINTGNYNTAVGNFSLANNLGGNGNVAVGDGSMRFQSGSNNTSVGRNSLYGYTGLGAGNTGSENTAVGYQALTVNTTGVHNTACGNYSMFSNKTGNYNSSFGRYALYNNTSGNENTGVGDDALYYNQTGSNNTAIGYFASPNAAGLSNTLSLGYNTLTTASNQVRIGNSTITSIGGYTGWTNISDGRVKKNIRENVPGLVFINQLKPVTYNLDLAAADKIINKAPAENELKKDKENAELSASRNKKEQIIYTGFVAQEVEQAAKKIDYEFSGVDAPKNDKDLYGIRYAEFVVPLVKAVQELSAENEQLKNRLTQVEALLKLNIHSSTLRAASLEQNVPNPSGGSTKINYTLPVKYVSAFIVITDNVGKKIKSINLSGSGRGAVVLNTGAMGSGTFQYSLYLNDSLVETKQMIIAK